MLCHVSSFEKESNPKNKDWTPMLEDVEEHASELEHRKLNNEKFRNDGK